MPLPAPLTRHPIPGWKGTAFLKAIVDNPLIEVGDLFSRQVINIRLIVINSRARHDVSLFETIRFGFFDQIVNRHRLRRHCNHI